MKMRPLVLAIAADDAVGETLRAGFDRCAIDTVVVRSATLGLRSLSTLAPDVVLVDAAVDDVPAVIALIDRIAPISSTDPRGLTAAGTKAVGAAAGNKNIPGIDKQNKYRVWGGIFKGEKAFDAGLLRAGLWLDQSNTDRHQYDRDLTLGVIPNPVEKTAPFDVLFHQLSKINSLQPFAEFELEPVAGLTVTPGIKRVDIKRSIDADVNQTTRLPLNYLPG